MEQFELFFKHDEETLRRWLEKETRFTVRLAVTENSTRMLSVKGVKGGVSVRLHRVFLEAPSDVLKEAALFIKKRRGKTPLINGYIRSKRESIKEGGGRRVVTRTRGEHHDLQSIFDSLNSEYFGSSVRALITWGAPRSRRSVRIRTLGSYGYSSGVIRINPLLDEKRVPGYFVAYVVYHEMLHAHMGVGMNASRRSIHPREFRERERLYKDYLRATVWEKAYGA
ncbi:MAG: hypothetical protein HY891_02815 [Deltaproteobacteria bacterium]|nr:hypothetical protein [Deltaproteobacteria bacterium]